MSSEKQLKKYTKKMFLDYANGFDYNEDAKLGNLGKYKSDAEIKEDMKKWKLKDFREFYGFTHKDWNTGKEYKAIEGVNCMECFNIMKNDEHSSINKNYCRECLQ